MDAAGKVGLREVFGGAAKKLPFVAAYMAYSSMQAEAQAFEEAGRPDLAQAARMAGLAEMGGGVFGGLTADLSRESMRKALMGNNPEFAAITKSGTRQIVEGAAQAGQEWLLPATPDIVLSRDAIEMAQIWDQQLVKGQPLAATLPASYRSMTRGTDMMGERNEVACIAVERTGFAASDPRNNLRQLSADKTRPMGHILVLENGEVQGPEQGGIDFGSNPKLAAGRNGGTIGVLYAGQGAMKDAQYNTVTEMRDWLTQQRSKEGLTSPVELIAGSTTTAELHNLPTPRGPLPSYDGPAPLPRPKPMLSNGTSGP